MSLLLDTNVLLWWLRDDPRLGATARHLIEDSDQEPLVSDVSLWEIVVKVRIGKLRVDLDDVVSACARSGFRRVALLLPHLQRLAELPMHHRDPFDHLLVAQALVEGATLITGDTMLQHYPGRILLC